MSDSYLRLSKTFVSNRLYNLPHWTVAVLPTGISAFYSLSLNGFSWKSWLSLLIITASGHSWGWPFCATASVPNKTTQIKSSGTCMYNVWRSAEMSLKWYLLAGVYIQHFGNVHPSCTESSLCVRMSMIWFKGGMNVWDPSKLMCISATAL